MVFRSGRTWKSRAVVCAAALALTGLAVYAVGVASTGRAKTTFTARATVCYQAPTQSAAPDLQVILQPIADDANLRWALHQSALDAGAAPEAADPAGFGEELARVRQDLSVTVGRTAMPGQVEVAIAFTGPDAREAASLVNHLAQRFAQKRRAAAQQVPASDGRQQARDAAERAREQWLAAKEQRDAFLQHYFRGLEAEAKRLEARPAPSPVGAVPPQASRFVPARPVRARVVTVSASQVDNPEWLDLTGQIAALQKKRVELLNDRTPLHPAVREVETKITELQARLGAVPRTVTQPGAGPPDETDIPPLPPTESQLDDPPIEQAPAKERDAPPRGRPSAPASPPALEVDADLIVKQNLAAVRDFAEQTEALRRAWQRYEELAAAQRRAADRQQAPVAPVELKLAGAWEVARAPQHDSRVALVALVAGLAAAASIGLLSLGSGDPPFASAAEVQATLAVPVIGNIRSEWSR